MIDYEIAILIAVLSFVYTNILTEPEMIFNSAYKWCDRVMPRWLFFPFIHCEKCNAGQIALITYIWEFWPGFYFYPLETTGHCALFVAFTIFTVYTVKQLWEKLKP